MMVPSPPSPPLPPSLPPPGPPFAHAQPSRCRSRSREYRRRSRSRRRSTSRRRRHRSPSVEIQRAPIYEVERVRPPVLPAIAPVPGAPPVPMAGGAGLVADPYKLMPNLLGQAAQVRCMKGGLAYEKCCYLVAAVPSEWEK